MKENVLELIGAMTLRLSIATEIAKILLGKNGKVYVIGNGIFLNDRLRFIVAQEILFQILLFAMKRRTVMIIPTKNTVAS